MTKKEEIEFVLITIHQTGTNLEILKKEIKSEEFLNIATSLEGVLEKELESNLFKLSYINSLEE